MRSPDWAFSSLFGVICFRYSTSILAYLLNLFKGTIFCWIFVHFIIICKFGLRAVLQCVNNPTTNKEAREWGKEIYYLGGSDVFRLSYLLLLKNILFEIKIDGICNRFSNQELLFEFIFLLFRQSFVSVAECCIKPNRWMGKVFWAVYSPKEEETAPNGLPLDLSIFNKAGYLCIRHKGWMTDVD